MTEYLASLVLRLLAFLIIASLSSLPIAFAVLIGFLLLARLQAYFDDREHEKNVEAPRRAQLKKMETAYPDCRAKYLHNGSIFLTEKLTGKEYVPPAGHLDLQSQRVS